MPRKNKTLGELLVYDDGKGNVSDVPYLGNSRTFEQTLAESERIQAALDHPERNIRYNYGPNRGKIIKNLNAGTYGKKDLGRI